jgi:alkyldihydroxyacetonephosphate synthase
MTEPTAPIAFGVEPQLAGEQFGASAPLGRGVIEELASICPTSTDDADRAEHGRDWWPLAMHWALAGNTPRKPHAVCRPSATDHVVRIVNVCRNNNIALTVSAGRSGVCGSAIPQFGGVVLDTTQLAGVVSVDEESGIVEVLPGTFGPEMERELQENFNLTVGHFPQSFDISTVGGWVACRGAGQFSTRYGKIEDMVVALEVVLADGAVIRTGGVPAGATGSDLTQLFIGSEGTLGVITRVWLRAHPKAVFELRAAYLFPSFAHGIAACREAFRNGATPAVLRLYDASESKRSHGTDGTQCTLLVLDEGDERLVRATLSMIDDSAKTNGATSGNVDLVEKWLQHRNDTSGLQALTSKGYIVDTMEVAAPWSKLVGIFDDVRAAFLGVDGARAATCHLSHSYLDGACLYFTFAADRTENINDAYVALWNAGQRAAIAAGSNVSHHHGVGLNRARFMSESLGNTMQVLQGIKDMLDPTDIFNPGKMGLTTNRGNVVWP